MPPLNRYRGKLKVLIKRGQQQAERFAHHAEDLARLGRARIAALRDIEDFLGGQIVAELQQAAPWR